MSEKPDAVEVGRMANELAATYGLGAHRHARKLAEEAAAAGAAQKQAFWEAVAAELNPRCSI